MEPRLDMRKLNQVLAGYDGAIGIGGWSTAMPGTSFLAWTPVLSQNTARSTERSGPATVRESKAIGPDLTDGRARPGAVGAGADLRVMAAALAVGTGDAAVLAAADTFWTGCLDLVHERSIAR
jgi:hypothetical protein